MASLSGWMTTLSGMRCDVSRCLVADADAVARAPKLRCDRVGCCCCAPFRVRCTRLQCWRNVVWRLHYFAGVIRLFCFLGISNICCKKIHDKNNRTKEKQRTALLFEYCTVRLTHETEDAHTAEKEREREREREMWVHASVVVFACVCVVLVGEVGNSK